MEGNEGRIWRGADVGNARREYFARERAFCEKRPISSRAKNGWANFDDDALRGDIEPEVRNDLATGRRCEWQAGATGEIYFGDADSYVKEHRGVFHLPRHDDHIGRDERLRIAILLVARGYQRHLQAFLDERQHSRGPRATGTCHSRGGTGELQAIAGHVGAY